MGLDRKKHKKSHLINHCPPSSEVSKVSERVAERANAEQVRSKRRSERYERTSERTSKWPSTLICILDYSGPQWQGYVRTRVQRKICTVRPRYNVPKSAGNPFITNTVSSVFSALPLISAPLFFQTRSRKQNSF